MVVVTVDADSIRFAVDRLRAVFDDEEFQHFYDLLMDEEVDSEGTIDSARGSNEHIP